MQAKRREPQLQGKREHPVTLWLTDAEFAKAKYHGRHFGHAVYLRAKLSEFLEGLADAPERRLPVRDAAQSMRTGNIVPSPKPAR